MLAIFNSEIEAVTFSNKIHAYLTKNRPKYNAERWSYPNKSDFEEKWLVKVPFDYKVWPVKLVIKEVVESVPIADAKVFLSTWKTIKEVLPIEIIKTK